MTNNPLIITCAVVGAELTKKDTPYLPLTLDQIADSACEAVKEGATIIHLHVRDNKGKPSQNVELFDLITKKIINECDCIIQYSTGGAVGTLLDQRCAPVSLKPDMASLSMGTMNFGPEIFENSEKTIKIIAKTLIKNSVMPELEIFDAGMLDTVKRFLKKKIIPKKFHVNFVLGVPGGMNGDLENLNFLTNKLHKEQTWTVSGIGKYQLPLTTHAISLGGHVRVGFEDNIYFNKGELAKSNAQFIKRIKKISEKQNRFVANVKEARKILRLLKT